MQFFLFLQFMYSKLKKNIFLYYFAPLLNNPTSALAIMTVIIIAAKAIIVSYK